MRTPLAGIGLLAMVLAAGSAEAQVTSPFERDTPSVAQSPLDEHVEALLRERGIEPAHPCSDEVFLRRIHLDLIGTLPRPREVRQFLTDPDPQKRAARIDALLERPEFADYWTLKWSDLLRVKAEFPINLWPNAVQAYHRWIHDSIRRNKPYDHFARELLTSSGSNFRAPAVNFYRAIQGREPSDIARAAALTFMGVRLERWPDERQDGMEVFFSRVAYKRTAEWKEEVVYPDPTPADALEGIFPDGNSARILPGEDPRRVFADWLIRPDNEWFARNIVNRIWSWLLGRGIIHEPDDIRPDNPASNPELLAYLEEELVAADYDLRHIYRLILNSRTYQQSSIPRSDHPATETLFAVYPVRRLSAEVLIDALCWICGPGEGYSSAIPEPFTFIPGWQRSISIADGSITSPFLEMFGRPARDTGLESERSNRPTDAQLLHLLNSTHLQGKIDRSWRLRQLLKTSKGNRRRIVRSIYITVLSRDPMPAEVSVALEYFATDGLSRKEAAGDLVWALINTKEFLYRH